MRKLLMTLVGVVLLLVLVVPSIVSAATTADITVTATPQSVAITIDIATYDFGEVAVSSTPSSSTSYFTIDNTSNVQTDQTISVTTTTWSGGVTWAHSDLGTPGEDQAGMKANQGGTWGVSDILIKNASVLDIVTDQPADTDYSFGIKLWAPTSFGDAVEKQIITRITAAAG